MPKARGDKAGTNTGVGKRKRGNPGGNGPLSEADKVEIVTRLAMYDTVGEIHRSLAERGVEVTIQAVANYNPTRSTILAQKWVTLFHETRERFHAEMMAEPMAQRAYRLRQLHKLYLQAEKKGAIPLAASLLEQAAKETGGLYTNVTKVKGQLDAPMSPAEVTSDEQRIMLADRLKDAMMKRVKVIPAKQLSDQSAKG